MMGSSTGAVKAGAIRRRRSDKETFYRHLLGLVAAACADPGAPGAGMSDWLAVLGVT